MSSVLIAEKAGRVHLHLEGQASFQAHFCLQAVLRSRGTEGWVARQLALGAGLDGACVHAVIGGLAQKGVPRR